MGESQNIMDAANVLIDWALGEHGEYDPMHRASATERARWLDVLNAIRSTIEDIADDES